MQILIFGGSAGGKSGYAGRLAEKLAGGRVIRYIATMPEQSEDARKKIRRHERLRQNGNYEVRLCLTLSDLEREIRKIREMKEASAGIAGTVGEAEGRGPVVLLDSLDGFLADVMFGSGTETETERTEQPLEKMLFDSLQKLSEYAGHLILVSDDYYRDGSVYDPQTEHFIAASGRLLREICKTADAVIEVIFGIPVPVTGKCPGGSDPHRMNENGLHFRTGGALNELFEIPYFDDVDLHKDPPAAD